ncbi:MAG: hypothetical protein ACI8RZ_000440 [Myxococcota bacterium]|jgi:hypothetical protein
MPQPTHDNIAPLIADLQSSGRSVRVVFRCPVSGDQFNANHSVSGRPAASSQLMNTAKRSMMYSLQRAVSSTIRDVFGYNMVGRVASDVARSAVQSATQNTNRNTLSDAEQRDATLEAFKKVSQKFVWDSNRGHWISAKSAGELLSPFERQLGEHPVEHNYDRTVLARMLVEVARADGRLSNEESSWLTDFIAPDLGSVRDLTARPPLSGPELGEASAGGPRQTMLMVAWTLALADEHFADQENAVLQGFAKGLKLNSSQVQTARTSAQGYILDQVLERMFTWGGHDTTARQQLMDLASRLGMSSQEAQVAEARYQRRKGFG